jgi:hypothetical protein
MGRQKHPCSGANDKRCENTGIVCCSRCEMTAKRFNMPEVLNS